MQTQTCKNCGRSIEDHQESFTIQNIVVCKPCKLLLEGDSQNAGISESKTETNAPIAEILPPVRPLFDDDDESKYGGIRRRWYIGGLILIGVINAFINPIAQGKSEINNSSMTITVISCVAIFILVFNRLHNIGTSGWWTLFMFVPIANIAVVIKCIIYPEGYEQTKKLDTAGKILAGICIGFIVISLVCIALKLLFEYKKAL